MLLHNQLLIYLMRLIANLICLLWNLPQYYKFNKFTLLEGGGTCPNGLPAVGPCVNGMCGPGFVCNLANNLCCTPGNVCLSNDSVQLHIILLYCITLLTQKDNLKITNSFLKLFQHARTV